MLFSKKSLWNSLFAELPDQGPHITGGRQNYQLGDRLELNCSSPRTFPPQKLKWYINNQTVGLHKFSITNFFSKNVTTIFFLQADQFSKNYPHKRGSKHGLFRTQVGLNVTVSRSLFKNGEINVQCKGYVEEGILQVRQRFHDFFSWNWWFLLLGFDGG